MKTVIRLAAAMAALVVLCAPSVALASVSPESPPEELIGELINAWGSWYAFSGIAVSLLILLWRKVKPQVWDQLSPRWRRLIPPIVSGPTAFVGMWALGADWRVAIGMLVYTWVTALGTGEVIQIIFGKGDSGTGTTATTLLGGLVLCAIPLMLLGCQPPKSASDIERTALVGYALAVEVVEATDNATATWVESLDEPTTGELEVAERIADALVKARELLVVARERLLDGEEVLDELRDVVAQLSRSVTLLEASGVRLPDQVGETLAAVSELLGDPQ